MRRAREIERRANERFRREAGPDDLDENKTLVLKVLFGMCLVLAWAEFKTGLIWISTEEAARISGYTDRQVRNWVAERTIIGVLTSACGHVVLFVNKNSLVEYLAELPVPDPQKEYIDSEAAAELLKKTSRTIRNWFNAGRLPGVLSKNALFLEKLAVEALV